MRLSQEQRKFKAGLKAFRASDAQDLSLDRLEETANRLNSARLSPLTSQEVREVIAEITKELEVTLTPSGGVVDPKTFVSWIQSREIETPRWDAYKQLLLNRDWEEPVINDLQKQSSEIVELLGDPLAEGPWSRRGLLMGEVQSGKTANYIGILNLALDHGYKVVIVIGGHTRPLRKQTQSRIDSDLLGIDSEYVEDNLSVSLRKIGIGKIDSNLRANLMTTVNRDFDEKSRSAGVHWIEADIPTVFVIKKNAKLIENVANYIRRQSGLRKLDAPLIIIDDESDWGSPNTRSENDPTRVNKAIRNLLDTSTRASYLAITATPFANIFIDDAVQDPEHGADLFPSDYIRVLSSPSTYFGLAQYFLPNHGGIRLDVDDCVKLLPITHKRSHVLQELPESLKRALVTFVLGTAIRSKRNKHKSPASMLVNISRFNDVQAKVACLIEDYLELLTGVVKSEARRNSGESSPHFQFVMNTWLAEFDGSVEMSWSEVSYVLPEIVEEISLQLVNTQTASARIKARGRMTDEQRQLEDLKPTIYVGGDVLSRGITLDGLQVSYFVREPRTMDTLMQMGRWFGYRPGYIDLVRVWLPASTAEDLSWSATVTEELREMLLSMKARGMTPRDFGLRVRTHPEGFLIVAANKSKATKQIYEGPIIWHSCVRESFVISGDTSVNAENLKSLALMVEKLERLVSESGVKKAKSISGYLTWTKVPLDAIRDFFNGVSFPVQSVYFGPGENGSASLIQQALPDVKNSDYWDVTLIEGDSESPYQLAEGISVKVSRREKMRWDQEDKVWRLANRRVSAGASLFGSLTDEQLSKFRDSGQNSGKRSQEETVKSLSAPKLLVFLVGRTSALAEMTAAYTPTVRNPSVAVVVAFPPLTEGELQEKLLGAKKYTGNSVYLRNLYSYSLESDDLVSEEGDG